LPRISKTLLLSKCPLRCVLAVLLAFSSKLMVACMLQGPYSTSVNDAVEKLVSQYQVSVVVSAGVQFCTHGTPLVSQGWFL
jgi:hypothetical protein